MGDDVGWRYADLENQLLCEVVLFLGANLVELDEFIEGLEDKGAKAGEELRERRREALKLFGLRGQPGQSNLPEMAFLRHLEWIILRKRWIEREKFLVPKAKQAMKNSEVQRLRRLNKPGTSDDYDIKRNERICTFCDRLEKAGERDFLKQAAEEFGLSRRRIAGIRSLGRK